MGSPGGRIPWFDKNGNLPRGIHRASVADIERRFTWNAKRQSLFRSLRRALASLAAAGVSRVYLAGSFISSKQQPADVDGFWLYDPSVDLGIVDSVLLSESPPRLPMKRAYGVDFVICWTGLSGREGQALLRFFGRDRQLAPRGILEIDLRTEAP